MPVEFDIKLEVKDMYRFNMYHSYTGFQGILSIIVAVIAFVFAFKTYGNVTIEYTLLYVIFGIVFLLYMPMSIYTGAKRQILMSEVMKNALHYKVDDSGIVTSQGEQSAQLNWNQIYKIIETKSNILVYSSRKNAYIIPKEQLGTSRNDLAEIFKKNMEPFRLKIK